MPASISSGVAKPSASTKNASLIIGTKIRLTTKPGAFLTVMGLLPKRLASAWTASWVASVVCKPRMISTKAIMGTGLKKCMPIKRSARVVAAASLVIEIEEVFDATMTSAASKPSTCFKILTLRSKFSVAASMTNWAFCKSSYCVLPLIRASAEVFSASVIFSFLINRSRLLLTVAMPLATAASVISTITTFTPETAHACAMPLPIVPAPMMPTV